LLTAAHVLTVDGVKLNLTDRETPMAAPRLLPIGRRISARGQGELAALARRADRTLSREIRRALQHYIAHYEIPPGDPFEGAGDGRATEADMP
jgi:hypothetical protein